MADEAKPGATDAGAVPPGRSGRGYSVPFASPGSSSTRTADPTERYGRTILPPAALARLLTRWIHRLPDILEPAQIEAMRRMTGSPTLMPRA